MNRSALLHRPLSEFAHAVDEHTFVIRLRAQHDDLKTVTLFFADRARMVRDLTYDSMPMRKVRADDLHDWFEATVQDAPLRMEYYFQLDDGREQIFYFGDSFETVAQGDRSDFFQFPFNHHADRLRVADWVHDAVVYNIFPDSFADGARRISGVPSEAVWNGVTCHSRLGGTVEGIRQNLDYIQDLGFNTLYMNPFFAADSYHKYDLLDYFHIDPTRGTDEDFHRLVRDAHDRGMKVLIDGVFNHMSANHPFFRNVLAKGKASAYHPWFYEMPDQPIYPKQGEQPNYMCFSYVPSMPKTDTSYPAMLQYFCDVGVYWVREFDVDGWRLDVANEVDDSFLRAFRRSVKAVKPDAVVLGEVWENAAHYINHCMMDGAMNYDFRRFCMRFFADGTLSAEEFDRHVTQLLMRYPTQSLPAQLNLLDSHDVSRFLSICGGDRDKMELAILFQMTFIGMPCVFYGDEKGLTGVEDLEYRQAMDFVKQDPLEAVYRDLIALRHRHSALRRGEFRTELAKNGVYRYTRDDGQERVTVMMNLGSSPAPLPKKNGLIRGKGAENDSLKPLGYAVWAEKA